MFVPIVSKSALEFWLYSPSSFKSDKYAVNKRKLVTLPANFRLKWPEGFIRGIAEEYQLSLPLCIMASDENSRRHYKYYTCKARPENLPEESFIKLDRSVWVSSPELCFLQIAPYYSIPELVRIANDLCSTFVVNPNAQYLQSNRKPVTNVALIKKFLGKVKNIKGLRKAKIAIRYAVDNSRSPMESNLAALFSLPLVYGGYGLKKPKMNYDIHLSEKAAALHKNNKYCCDMLWEEEKVILEYDSNLAHLDVIQHSKDKRKYSALTISGYNVLMVTADQIASFKSIEDLCDNLRVLLKKKKRGEAMQKYATRRWKTVQTIMFSPNGRM